MPEIIETLTAASGTSIVTWMVNHITTLARKEKSSSRMKISTESATKDKNHHAMCKRQQDKKQRLSTFSIFINT